jgi:hypothetical protein
VSAISGKDFAKLLEKKAGNCGERREAIIFTPKRKTQLGSQCPYMEIARSR